MSVRLPVTLLVSSPVVPPAVFGQAVVLGRLFGAIDTRDYQYVSFRSLPRAVTHEPGGTKPKVHELFSTWHFKANPPGYPLAAIRSNRQFIEEIRWRSRQLGGLIGREGIGALLVTSDTSPDPAAAAIAARRAGIPLIVYMFDEWREILALDRWLGPLASLLQDRVMRAAAGTIVANRALGESMDRRYGTRSMVIFNPVSSHAVDSRVNDEVPWPARPGEVSLVFTGHIYAANLDALERIVDALQLPQLANATLRLYSQGKAAQSLVDRGAGRVTLHPFVEPDEVPAIQRSADVLIMPLAFSSPYPEAIRTAAPTKFGEYLASGRPVLIHAPPDSFPVTFARSEGLGEIVDTPDIAAVKAAIGRITNDSQRRSEMRRRAIHLAKLHFSTDAITSQFAETVSSMIEQAKGLGR